MKPSLPQIIIPVFSIILFGFNPPQEKADSVAAVITGEKILSHIKVLASDEFEGRAPGTKGEALSVNYLIDQCKKLGLEPGNPDGTYRQHVLLAGFRAQNLSANFTVGSRTITTDFPNDVVLVSRRFVDGEVSVKNSDMIFVGYGITAPEFGWDDFKDVDVRGKTIVMLINDPPVPDPKDPSLLDSTMFGGNAMTYYGRWTYRYEIAAQRGPPPQSSSMKQKKQDILFRSFQEAEILRISMFYRRTTILRGQLSNHGSQLIRRGSFLPHAGKISMS